MESSEDLQSLIERAWALTHRLDEEINSSFGHCKFCSRQGRCCDAPETEFEERQRLIAIRDSLKDTESFLVFLQRLRSWQLLDRHAAFTRLEESRSLLIDNVSQYRGRPLEVVRDLHTSFGHSITAFSLTSKDRGAKTMNDPGLVHSHRRPVLGFLVCCFKLLISPWKWHEGIGIALKLAAAPVGVWWMMYLVSCRQQRSCGSRRGLFSLMDSGSAAEEGDDDSSARISITIGPLDVLRGMG